jgi:uncharacterized RDD family membrane protein YckC
MQGENPYSAPNSNVADIVEDRIVLADRGMRLLAAFIDGILMMVVIVPVMFATGVFTRMMAGEASNIGFSLGIGLFSIGVFLAIQGYPLYNSGQTWAKKWLKMKIVDMDGKKPEFFKLIGLRYLTVQAIGLVPFVGGLFSLVDACFIFGDSRRCIHDLMAGTQVVLAD